MSRAGVALVPDHRALFTRLSTIENLRVADPIRRRSELRKLFDSLSLSLGAEKAKLAAGQPVGG